MNICIGARKSRLSQRQVAEVLADVQTFCPAVTFAPLWIETVGDRQLDRSLRPLDKTDFFTREIDQLLLKGTCRLAIHSAKDLPDPLPDGLCCVALTAGKTALDALVLAQGERLETLPKGAWIGSSSVRRDWIVQRLRPDLQCKEVRGTIEKRLLALEKGEIAGLVVAEAALQRLGLTTLTREILPGESAPLQGKLAVVARLGDREMEELFSPLDDRRSGSKKVWYTGLKVPKTYAASRILHAPLIAIQPRKKEAVDLKTAWDDLSEYTHCLITSQTTARLLGERLEEEGHSLRLLREKKVIAIGQATAAALKRKGLSGVEVVQRATQEGIIEWLRMQHLDEAYVLLPQSARARTVLSHFLQLQGVRHQVCLLYETLNAVPNPIPDLSKIDELVFTSPSTVASFSALLGKIPKAVRVTAMGKVTATSLRLLGVDCAIQTEKNLV